MYPAIVGNVLFSSLALVGVLACSEESPAFARPDGSSRFDGQLARDASRRESDASSIADADPGRDARASTDATPDGLARHAGEDASRADGAAVFSSYCDLVSAPTRGYAAHRGVTGGLAYCANPVVVTSLADSGPGSLRDTLQSNRYIVFDPSLRGRTINLQKDIVTTELSNVTVDGRALTGESLGVTLTAHALKFDGAENLIVSNLRFVDNNAEVDSDGLTIRGLSGRETTFYVARNTFINAADGALDIIWKRGEDMWGTVEGNLFRCNNKTLLVNSTSDPDDSYEAGGRYYVTFAANWFDQSEQRMPLARVADIHYFNNVITRQASGGKAFQASYDVHALLEDNAMRSGDGSEQHCRGVQETGRRFAFVTGPSAALTLRDNLFLDGGSGEPYNEDRQGDGLVDNALTVPYSYVRSPMNRVRMNEVMQSAGAQ